MSASFCNHSNGAQDFVKQVAFAAALIAILASQIFATYRIPTGVTLLPIGTPKADTQVFQTCIVKDTQWAYFVYLPPTYDPNGSKVWPCYVNVPAFNYNGSGNLADIFTTHMANGGMAELLQSQQPAKLRQISSRFIVITPYVDWNVCSSISGHPERIHNLFDTLTKVFKIDKTRMNMGGYCFGAGVTYTFATFYPRYMNHIMLFAGNDNWASTFNLAKACSLKTLPIRQYADSVCTCNDGPTAKAAWTAIMACGGNNDSLTFIGTGWHEVWGLGGFDTATTVYDWLLSGPPTAVVPQIVPDNASHFVVDHFSTSNQIELVGLNGQILSARRGSLSDMHRILSNARPGMYLLRTTTGSRMETRPIFNK